MWDRWGWVKSIEQKSPRQNWSLFEIVSNRPILESTTLSQAQLRGGTLKSGEPKNIVWEIHLPNPLSGFHVRFGW